MGKSKTNSQYTILVADDEPAITTGVSELLREETYRTMVADDGESALLLLEKQPVALVLIDLMMPGLNGLELLAAIKQKEIPTGVIIITGKGTITTAVEAIKSGAFDYLTKPVHPDRLRTTVRKALEHQDLILTNKRLEATIKQMTRYENLIGRHKKMQAVYKLIDAVADTTANVIVTGESGTGKELVARAIHQKSSRSKGPFVAVNCSAFPTDLLENELFGHEISSISSMGYNIGSCFSSNQF